MPAKSKSPEAAQRKVWQTEIRTHQKAATKIIKDFNAEERRLKSEVIKAHRVRESAKKKLESFVGKKARKQANALAAIERRIAVLHGRLGL